MVPVVRIGAICAMLYCVLAVQESEEQQEVLAVKRGTKRECQDKAKRVVGMIECGSDSFVEYVTSGGQRCRPMQGKAEVLSRALYLRIHCVYFKKPYPNKHIQTPDRISIHAATSHYRGQNSSKQVTRDLRGSISTFGTERVHFFISHLESHRFRILTVSLISSSDPPVQPARRFLLRQGGWHLYR
jgi:hypothetical protein